MQLPVDVVAREDVVEVLTQLRNLNRKATVLASLQKRRARSEKIFEEHQ